MAQSSVTPVTIPEQTQRALAAVGAARCAIELRPNLVVLGALNPSSGVFTYSVFAVPEDDVASGRGADAIAPDSVPVVTGAVALAAPQPDHAYELVAAVPWTGHVMLLVRNRAAPTTSAADHGDVGVFSLDARNGTVLALGALSLHQRLAHLGVAATGAGDLVLVEAVPPVAASATGEPSWDVTRTGGVTAVSGSDLMQPLYIRVFAAGPLIAASRFAKASTVSRGWAALPALAAPVAQALSVASPLSAGTTIHAVLQELQLVRNTRASFRIVLTMLLTDGALDAAPVAAIGDTSGPTTTVHVDVATVHVTPAHDEAPTLSVTPVPQPPASPPILSPASPAANAPPLTLRVVIPAPGRVEDPTPTKTDVTVADITVIRDANGFDAVEECSICFCPFELSAPAAAPPGGSVDPDASQTAPACGEDEEDLAGDATVTLLACGHQFHYECLRMALARAGSFKPKGQYIRFGGLKCPMGCGALVREPALCPELEQWHALRAVVGKLAAAEDAKLAAAVAATDKAGNSSGSGGSGEAAPAAALEGLSVSSPLQVNATASPSPAISVDAATTATTTTATTTAAAVLEATEHATTEDRLKRHLFYLCHKCDRPFPGGPYDCQATLNDPECSPAALLCDNCIEDFSCASHGRSCVVYKCARCWERATRRFMGRQFMCEACLAEKGKPLPAAAVSAAVVATTDGAAKPAAPPAGSAFAAVPLSEFAVVGHDDAGMGSSVVGCGLCKPGLLQSC